MSAAHGTLTVAFRATNEKWAQMAAAAAWQLCGHGMPEVVKIVRYDAGKGRKERYSSGYEALLPVETDWLLSIDADSHVYGDVRELVRGAEERGALVALRESPLQQKARVGWRQDRYEELFGWGRPYRSLGTTCAFLLHQRRAISVLANVEECRQTIDQGAPLADVYHHAQVAFALVLASAGIGEEVTWWLGPEQVSFTGEPHGIIHHEGLRLYKSPIVAVSEGNKEVLP